MLTSGMPGGGDSSISTDAVTRAYNALLPEESRRRAAAPSPKNILHVRENTAHRVTTKVGRIFAPVLLTREASP